MPIGGTSQIVDANPVKIQLDQVTMDGAIAQYVENKQLEQAIDGNVPGDQVGNVINKNPDIGDENDTLSGIQNQEDNTQNAEGVDGSTSNINNPDSVNDCENIMVSDVQNVVTGVQTAVSGIQDDSTIKKDLNLYDEDTEAEESGNEQPKKGYVKVTTHGIRKKSSVAGRLYRCTVCGKKKRSAHKLNEHHKRRHSSQMCGICGKLFDLASTLTHHMYSHDERRYYCSDCSFHSHFESELKKHRITHHTQPSHQCMHKNCGRWFKRKSDLVLHVETHKKNLLQCDFCDHTTTLPKYMKEHMKSHGNILPYKCDVCNKRFLWWSSVRAHKQKEHGPNTNTK